MADEPIRNRLVIVTNGNYFSRRILDRLFSERASDISGIVTVSGDYSGRKSLSSLWSVGRKTTFPYLVAKVLQMFFLKAAEIIFPECRLNVERLAITYGKEILTVTSVNDKRVFNALRSWRGDLLVSVSCPQKIRDKHLRYFSRGGVNIHSSLLPTYAGLAPYYWVLSEGDRVAGTTVHVLTQRFDDGNILVQKQVAIDRGVSACRLFEYLTEVGGDALKEAIELVESGYEGKPQELRKRSYYSHPTLVSYINLRRNGFRIFRWADLFGLICRECKGRNKQ